MGMGGVPGAVGMPQLFRETRPGLTRHGLADGWLTVFKAVCVCIVPAGLKFAHPTLAAPGVKD